MCLRYLGLTNIRRKFWHSFKEKNLFYNLGSLQNIVGIFYKNIFCRIILVEYSCRNILISEPPGIISVIFFLIFADESRHVFLKDRIHKSVIYQQIYLTEVFFSKTQGYLGMKSSEEGLAVCLFILQGDISRANLTLHKSRPEMRRVLRVRIIYL